METIYETATPAASLGMARVYLAAFPDSVRHFFTKDEVKQLLDAMALNKLNMFHWHLDDDAGWRGEPRRFGEGIAILVGDFACTYADLLMRSAPPAALAR